MDEKRGKNTEIEDTEQDSYRDFASTSNTGSKSEVSDEACARIQGNPQEGIPNKRNYFGAYTSFSVGTIIESTSSQDCWLQ